jgi:hypothetical protein
MTELTERQMREELTVERPAASRGLFQGAAYVQEPPPRVLFVRAIAAYFSLGANSLPIV